MFNWLRRKDTAVLEFPDNASAFAHACTCGYPLLINARIPALVLEEGHRGSAGERCFLLHLASQQEPLEIWGCTLADAPAHPDVGDLVSFRIVRIATELPVHASLIGYIDNRLQPVLVGNRGWRIATSFMSGNIKPELHL
ncbi:hypothetical protein [Geobacter sp. SVR]|uniref:hypothetical protein n=1 Tax=Geobacter sp. SVR TaxID=2495594 RepID=UPI00143EFB0D|nr:hypothetical protein [Geobacter sp. SVR]BCS53971.1 hypothetical protein GSVR_22790 [Geobacter sp. SVR]GCF86248.1 hypothetical protein GSbR_28480 [Geobacter sp. SVR]